MTEKTDKFTAARIRLFAATGMAVQKALPFDRPQLGGQARMTTPRLQPRQEHRPRMTSFRRHA